MLERIFRPRRVVCAAFAVFAFGMSIIPAAAQQLKGRVTLQDAGIAGAAVELHRVTRTDAGVVARTTTDASGRFQVQLPPADTSGFTVWFATTQHLGVRYFGAPLHPNDALEGYTIAVFDTASVATAASSIQVLRRDVVLLPDPSGSWEVNEIFQIRNPIDRALVAPEGSPTWEFRIPAVATAFEAGEGEEAAATIVRMDDRVLLVAPLLPGSREVYVRYRLPASSAELPITIGTPTQALGVFVSEPAPAVTAVGLAEAEPLQAEGRTFRRFGAVDLEPGASVRVMWKSVGPPIDPRFAALAVVALLLAVGAIAAVWRGKGGGGGERGPGRGGTVAVPAVVRETQASAELVS